MSRLLWLLQSCILGYEVGHYISLERLVEQNKERYYETLEQSSQGWHEGSHDPWPYINYVLSILKTAYREFAERVGEVRRHAVRSGTKCWPGLGGWLQRLRDFPSANWSRLVRASAAIWYGGYYANSRQRALSSVRGEVRERHG